MRLLNTKNVLAKKFKTFESLRGIWKEVLGTPERSGIWLIYGKEKNGKTWCALMLASYLSKLTKTLYISAEEGISKHFQETLVRVNAQASNRRLYYHDYLSLDEVEELLSRRNPHRVVLFDNLTVYLDEFKNGRLREMQLRHPNTLFILIAHEEKNDVFTATGRMAKRLASVVMRVAGLKVFVSGRVPGGEFDIDTEKADLYYGQQDQAKQMP